MQLDCRHLRLLRPVALMAWLCTHAAAHADSRVDATTTGFYESGGNLHLTVIHPSVSADVDAGRWASVQAGWEADVVTGASVAIVDAPGSESGVDAVTSATKLSDVRHAFRGGATLRGDEAQVSAGYQYGMESDYRSHTAFVAAGAELFGRNTLLDVRYTRGWDAVCDLRQGTGASPVSRQRLPNSEGCFSAADRVRQSLSIHTLQGAWTQVLSPIWNIQWVLSTQLLAGFQANPYRAVWLGRAAAQEHHPVHRARYAAGLGSRLWLRPVGGALQFFAQVYRDTWDVRSLSVELAFERKLGERLRLRARGRYYAQTAAAFFSDDYAQHPVGQYFTGDRELSAMETFLGGLRADFTPRSTGRGILGGMSLVLKGDYLRYAFSNFHYGALAVPNRSALFGTAGLELVF